MWCEPRGKHPFYNSACDIGRNTRNATCTSTWNVEKSTDYWTVWNFQYSEDSWTHSSRNIQILVAWLKKKVYKYMKKIFKAGL